MDLKQLYEYAEDNNILITNVELDKKCAFCIDYNNVQGIGIDYTQIHSEQKKAY